MTVPNFLDKLTGKNPEEQKAFLALVLSSHRVQAAVWKVVGSVTEIVSLGTPVEWDGEVATTSELVSAVDATISSATEGLDLDPDEVVLGLANAWVDNGGIKQSKKDLIKNICRELSLKAIGYVVISDTIVRYLKMQEGSPPTSLLIQIDRRSVTLSLVELGSIKYTISVGASDNISSDVAEAITRLPQDVALPSRFILVSAMENTSDLIQSLTAYEWQDNFSFLHTPKIEALPKDVEVHATALAGGSEVAAALGFSLEEPSTDSPSEPEPTLDSPNTESDPLQQTPASSDLTAADLGFVPTSAEELEPIDTTDPQNEEPLAPQPTSSPSIKLPSLPKLPKLPSLPKFKFDLSIGNSLYFWLGGLIFVLIGLAALFYLIPQATVSLTVTAKPISETLILTLNQSADAALDLENASIPASYSQHEISGQESIQVTGKKTIGDPAKGEVTIYNRTSLPKTLLKGTTISANSLKFTLESDVTVASKSAGVDYVDVPGKANVKVIAQAFGSAGNLTAGTEFVVASFTKDSFVAKNDQAFSGGNSREVTVVSDADQKSLIQTLTTSLSDQLSASFLVDQTASEQHYVLLDDIKTIKSEFSHKIGEEASTLSLDLTLSLGVLKYNQNDVERLVQHTIKGSVPDGYTSASLPSSIKLTDTESIEDVGIRATADVTHYVTTSLDTPAIASTIRGKKHATATSFLTSLPGVTAANITLTPNLPPRLVSLPHNVNRINIVVDTVK